MLYAVLIAIGLTPPGVTTLIRIGNSILELRKGQLCGYAREQVSEQLLEAKVQNGYIAITSGKRVVFSRSIPIELHQRLRNVLLNQTS